MNTEYAVGNFRIHFESRASRRWFVALFYAVVAALGFAPFWPRASSITGVWIVSAHGVLFTALVIVFTWIAGDMRARGDEREMHRRDHAHSVAYRIFLYVFIAALFCNPITGFVPLALQGFLVALWRPLLVAACGLFITLPQAILLCTEPDMDVDPDTAI